MLALQARVLGCSHVERIVPLPAHCGWLSSDLSLVESDRTTIQFKPSGPPSGANVKLRSGRKWAHMWSRVILAVSTVVYICCRGRSLPVFSSHRRLEGTRHSPGLRKQRSTLLRLRGGSRFCEKLCARVSSLLARGRLRASNACLARGPTVLSGARGCHPSAGAVKNMRPAYAPVLRLPLRSHACARRRDRTHAARTRDAAFAAGTRAQRPPAAPPAGMRGPRRPRQHAYAARRCPRERTLEATPPRPRRDARAPTPRRIHTHATPPAGTHAWTCGATFSAGTRARRKRQPRSAPRRDARAPTQGRIHTHAAPPQGRTRGRAERRSPQERAQDAGGSHAAPPAGTRGRRRRDASTRTRRPPQGRTRGRAARRSPQERAQDAGGSHAAPPAGTRGRRRRDASTRTRRPPQGRTRGRAARRFPQERAQDARGSHAAPPAGTRGRRRRDANTRTRRPPQGRTRGRAAQRSPQERAQDARGSHAAPPAGTRGRQRRDATTRTRRPPQGRTRGWVHRDRDRAARYTHYCAAVAH